MILKKVAKKLLDYDIVVRVEFLGTKVRAYLVEGVCFGHILQPNS